MSATKGLTNIETQHNDMIHDSQFDYYGRKLATCSSDRTIKIFDVTDGMHHHSATLTGHEGPVWQVAWAHPKFGVILASCSYDGSVIIHRENPPKTWNNIYRHEERASMNSIAWAPHEHGLVLAAASSDGRVTIIEHLEDQWVTSSFQNDNLGTNAVSWAPFGAIGSFPTTSSSSSSSNSDNNLPCRRLVTASCDKIVRIWRCNGTSYNNTTNNNNNNEWIEENKDSNTSPHSDWVRDVQWAPNTAMPYNIIASCSEDTKVVIWTQDSANKPWTCKVMHTFPAPVWRLSWSLSGNILAVSTGDHKVSLWKHTVDESWINISTVTE